MIFDHIVVIILPGNVVLIGVESMIKSNKKQLLGFKFASTISTTTESAVYFGNFIDNKLCGQGTLVSTFKNNFMIGPCEIFSNDRTLYVGTYDIDSNLHCNSSTYPSGNHYVGEFNPGLQRNGHGTMSYPDGSKYTGDWQADKYHGFGTRTSANGDVYEGQFVNNIYHGHGSFTLFDSGSIYEGEFTDGVLQPTWRHSEWGMVRKCIFLFIKSNIFCLFLQLFLAISRKMSNKRTLLLFIAVLAILSLCWLCGDE